MHDCPCAQLKMKCELFASVLTSEVGRSTKSQRARQGRHCILFQGFSYLPRSLHYFEATRSNNFDLEETESQ